jgi:hypothetical protein
MKLDVRLFGSIRILLLRHGLPRVDTLARLTPSGAYLPWGSPAAVVERGPTPLPRVCNQR